MIARLKICLLLPALAAGPARADNLLKPLPAKQWNEQAVVHLLRRAAFEGTPEQIKLLRSKTLAEAVDYLVEYERLPAPSGLPTFDPKLTKPPDHQAIKALEEGTRQRHNQARRLADRLQLERIRAWWLDRMVASPRQLQEKMTFFWHGHFTSGYREVRHSILLYEQNQLFRGQALGNYRRLLLDISSDPAMLIYLDSFRSKKKHPNENYARELLELFTLGEGHYGEKDVLAAARAFTGWSIEDGKFKFRRGQHDYGEKEFMGRVGPWNGGDIIDIILDQPQARRFIVTKLWEFFCFDDPPEPIVKSLAYTLEKSGFEIKPVVRRILMSRGFFSAKARGNKIKSPVQLTVGTMRALGVRDYDSLGVNQALATMNQQLFQPPNVKGWAGGEKWINTATYFNRCNFTGAMVNGHKGNKRPGMMMKMQRGAKEFGFMAPPPSGQVGQMPIDPAALLVENKLTQPGQIVDFLGKRLLAVDLPKEQRAKLVKYLRGDDGQFDRTVPAHLKRVRAVIHLLMSTPEYQLY